MGILGDMLDAGSNDKEQGKLKSGDRFTSNLALFNREGKLVPAGMPFIYRTSVYLGNGQVILVFQHTLRSGIFVDILPGDLECFFSPVESR